MSTGTIELRENLLLDLESLGKRERHIGEVIFYIYERGMSRIQAFKKVADKFRVRRETVQDKFLLGVGINASDFDRFLDARDWSGLFRRIEQASQDAPILHAFFRKLSSEPPKPVIGTSIRSYAEMTQAEQWDFISNISEELENDQ